MWARIKLIREISVCCITFLSKLIMDTDVIYRHVIVKKFTVVGVIFFKNFSPLIFISQHLQ